MTSVLYLYTHGIVVLSYSLAGERLTAAFLHSFEWLTVCNEGDEEEHEGNEGNEGHEVSRAGNEGDEEGRQ